MLRKQERALEAQLIEAAELLSSQDPRNQISRIKKYYYLATGNKNHTQLHNFMESLHGIGSTIEEINNIFEKELTKLLIEAEEEIAQPKPGHSLSNLSDGEESGGSFDTIKEKPKKPLSKISLFIEKIYGSSSLSHYVNDELDKNLKSLEENENEIADSSKKRVMKFKAFADSHDELKNDPHVKKAIEKSKKIADKNGISDETLIKELAHSFTKEFLEKLLDSNSTDDQRLVTTLNSLLSETTREEEGNRKINQDVAKFWHLFRNAYGDKEKPIFAHYRDKTDKSLRIVKFRVINNQLVPVYIAKKIEEDDGDGKVGFERTDITPLNRHLLANEKLNLTIDPETPLDLYAKDGTGNPIIFHLPIGDPVVKGDSIILNSSGNYADEFGNFYQIQSIRKINHEIGEDNKEIERGFEAFSSYIRPIFEYEPDIYTKVEVKDVELGKIVATKKKEKNDSIEESPLIKEEHGSSSSGEPKTTRTVIDIKKSNKLAEEQRDETEGIAAFTTGRRRWMKYYAHTISYYYAILCGVLTGYSTFNAVVGKNIGELLFNLLTGSNLHNKFESIALLSVLATPAIAGILFTVAGIYFIYAISIAIQAYAKGEPLPKREILTNLIIAIAIAGIAVSAILAVSFGGTALPIIAGLIIAGLALYSGAERNRRFSRKAGETTVFAITGSNKKKIFGNAFTNLFTKTDKHGFTHHLNNKYKTIAIIGIIGIIAVAILWGGVALGPFLPFLPIVTAGVAFTWLTIPIAILAVISVVVMVKVMFGFTFYGFNRLLFEIQEKGAWAVFKGFFIPSNTAGKSTTEVTILTIAYSTLFIFLLPIGVIGTAATYALGGNILAENFLQNLFHIPQLGAEAITSILFLLAITAGQIPFIAITTRDYVQDYLVNKIVASAKFVWKGIQWLWNYCYSKIVNPILNGMQTAVTVAAESKIVSNEKANAISNFLETIKSPAPDISTGEDTYHGYLNALANGTLSAGAKVTEPTAITVGISEWKVIDFVELATKIVSVNVVYYIELGAAAFVSVSGAAVNTSTHTCENGNEKTRLLRLIKHKETRQEKAREKDGEDDDVSLSVKEGKRKVTKDAEESHSSYGKQKSNARLIRVYEESAKIFEKKKPKTERPKSGSGKRTTLSRST